MTTTDLKQDFIEMVKEDPAGFLMDLFSEEGLFKTSNFDIHDLNVCPAIMRLENNGVLTLIVTVWDPFGGSFSRAEYYALGRETVEGDELVWDFTSVKYWHPHPPVRSLDPEADEAIGGCIKEWRSTILDLDEHDFISEYAWGFPCNAYWATKHPEAILTAVSRPTTGGETV